MPTRSSVPSTPKITAPSPPAEEDEGSDSYFPPTTRSATKRAGKASDTGTESFTDSDAEGRARSRSRSPSNSGMSTRRRRKSGVTTLNMAAISAGKRKPKAKGSAASNGHLSPASAMVSGPYAVRGDLSRSPSPLGLIPLHTSWRSFIHRHEIPRKALHVSIGFLTLRLYSLGIQPSAIHPWLMGALVPIASVDIVRRQWPAMNRLYVRLLGAFMRESEVNDRYNGVIWYLVGTWVAMRLMPKDVGVMSILLLSWCDTAASTVGRRWGRYTPRVRNGKSLAGSAAAAAVGVTTALLWWGWIVPSYYGFEDSFMFKGYLQTPSVPSFLGGGTSGGSTSSGSLWQAGGKVGGWLALGAMGLWSGLVASVSEAVDIFGIDDNLTIPVLSGIGLWGFLKVFG